MIIRVKEDTGSNIMRQPITFAYVGFITIVASILFMIIGFAVSSDDLDRLSPYLFLMTALFLLGLYLFLNAINWKLVLNEEDCTHTNFLGMKRTYRYTELRVIEYKAAYRVYYKKRRVFDISGFQDNFRAFPKYYRKHVKIETKSSKITK